MVQVFVQTPFYHHSAVGPFWVKKHLRRQTHKKFLVSSSSLLYLLQIETFHSGNSAHLCFKSFWGTPPRPALKNLKRPMARTIGAELLSPRQRQRQPNRKSMKFPLCLRSMVEVRSNQTNRHQTHMHQRGFVENNLNRNLL